MIQNITGNSPKNTVTFVYKVKDILLPEIRYHKLQQWVPHKAYRNWNVFVFTPRNGRMTTYVNFALIEFEFVFSYGP